jgi:hypothetical protein
MEQGQSDSRASCRCRAGDSGRFLNSSPRTPPLGLLPPRRRQSWPPARHEGLVRTAAAGLHPFPHLFLPCVWRRRALFSCGSGQWRRPSRGSCRVPPHRRRVATPVAQGGQIWHGRSFGRRARGGCVRWRVVEAVGSL